VFRQFGWAPVLALVLFPASLGADQAFGVGVRLAMVRGSVNSETSADRYTGGLLRARLSPRTALELSADWRTATNQALTERVRDLPIQGSLLLYPFRGGFSPYVLGGAGWYSQRVETLSESTVTSTVTSRTFGYHAGFGGELRLGRRAAIHADYRYTRVRFRDDEDPDAPSGGGLRVPGLAPLAERLKLSHDGSMWTGGLTLYF
jgi:hypothetical protein